MPDQTPSKQAPQSPQESAPDKSDEKTAVKTVSVKAHERQLKREASFAKRQAKAAAKAGKEEPAAAAEVPKEASHSQAESTSGPAAGAASESAKTAPTADAVKSEADLSKRYAIAERRLNKAKQRETALTQREQTLTRAEQRLTQVFGAPHEVKDAYTKGEYHAAAKALERWLGDDFATVTQKIARQTAGLSPERLAELEERDRLRRENAELAREKAEREQRGKAETTRAQALSTVTSKAAGHPALKVRGGAELILQELESSWDPGAKGFRLTIQQAADRVVAQRKADAEALGLRAAPPVPAPATKPVPAAKPAPAATEPKGRLSFEERQAMAARRVAKLGLS